jgi:hypothetical protein
MRQRDRDITKHMAQEQRRQIAERSDERAIGAQKIAVK